MAWFIGLMSGTSMDGVDAVLTQLVDGERPAVAAHVHRTMPADLHQALLQLNRSGPDELHRGALAAQALMRLYADAVQQLCAQGRVSAPEVAAIGAHGQTVRHRPDLGYTVQLVNGALLAELTGIDVVCDFRSRDVAAGGQGAPLVPAFHAALFRQPGVATALLNVGGIANLTWLGPDGDVSGWDTGPGNVLMDLWVSRIWGQAFDAGGERAAQGRCDAALLARMSREPYFALAPPKSTGRDLFHEAWLQAMLDDGVTRAPHDVLATLCELTALSAVQALGGRQPVAMYVCGGGAANAWLMNRLQALQPQVRVLPSDAVGVPADQMEALAFAWLAHACVQRRPGNLPAVTAAAGPRVLGALYPR